MANQIRVMVSLIQAIFMTLIKTKMDGCLLSERKYRYLIGRKGQDNLNKQVGYAKVSDWVNA